MEGGQLPCTTPGLAYASALSPPPDEESGDLCRICFGPDEYETSGDPADQLISPCTCSGSIAHIHCACLVAWRRQRCAEQGFRRSQQCEMCHAQYRIPQSHQRYFPSELLGGMLPGPQHCLHMLAARLRSPSRAAAFALDMWLNVVIMSGFNSGAQLACYNFNRTLALGLAMIQKNSQGLTPWNQVRRRGRLGLLPMHRRRPQPQPLVPLMQLPRVLGTSAFLAALSFEVLVLSGMSAYVGLLLGFGAGSWGMVHRTWSVARRVLRLGPWRIHPVPALLP